MLRRKFTSLSRDSEMKASFHYLSLLGALYNFIFSLSQNDYPRFFSERLLARPFKELKRFVSFYPRTSKSTRFLYYFCLCKSFKELSILLPTQNFDTSCRKSTALSKPQIHLVLHSLARFLGESECKGIKNTNTLQILKQKNSRKRESFRESLQIQVCLIYYI